MPFLVRLFPSLLTKVVYLNFREYPRAVPPTETPKTRVGPCRDGTRTVLIPLLLCRGLAEEARRDLSRCFASSNNVVLPTLFTACTHNTPGHAEHQRGWKLGWEEVAES